MASVSGMPPMLRLQRSAQSGAQAMAAAYAVVYTESSSQAYIFAGAEIDLSTMAAADIIDIRIRKQLASGGGWVNHDEVQFTDAQPTGHPSIAISPIPDVFGVEISMRQTAGVLRTIPCEFYDAKRLGLP
ncbi:MAG: hypothetical protein KAR06_03000 [Deltaproteobacteria bacterium]|nr:hypothetical protein [Deltaproteobacteria bacterium]